LLLPVVQEISRNKSELESMLSAFNIYVDTPCCVLTQEESKRLIHGTAKEKYQFFIKATGLRLVHDRLIATEAALDAAEEDKQRMLPEIGKLRQHRDDCKDRLAEFQALDKFQLQIAIENAKLLWDEVRTAEGVVEGMQADAAEKQAALDEAEEALLAESGDDSDRQREFDAVQEALAAIHAEEGPINERIAAAQADVVKVQRVIGKRKLEMTEYQRSKAENEQRYKTVTQEVNFLAHCVVWVFLTASTSLPTHSCACCATRRCRTRTRRSAW
jgi:chromosome segregation ATPase